MTVLKAYQLCKPDIDGEYGERIGTLSKDIYLHEGMASAALDREWDEWLQDEYYPIDELILDSHALMEVRGKYEWARDMPEVNYSCSLGDMRLYKPSFNYEVLTNEQLRVLLSHCCMGPFLKGVDVHIGTLWQVAYPVLDPGGVWTTHDTKGDKVYVNRVQAEVGIEEVRDQLRLTHDLSMNIEGKLLDYEGDEAEPYLVEVSIEDTL